MPGSLRQGLLLGRGLTCRRCLETFARDRISAPQTRRWIGTKYLAKVEAADKEWEKRAEQIKEGHMRNLWDIFEERGYIKDVAGSVSPYSFPFLSSLMP